MLWEFATKMPVIFATIPVVVGWRLWRSNHARQGHQQKILGVFLAFACPKSTVGPVSRWIVFLSVFATTAEASTWQLPSSCVVFIQAYKRMICSHHTVSLQFIFCLCFCVPTISYSILGDPVELLRIENDQSFPWPESCPVCMECSQLTCGERDLL